MSKQRCALQGVVSIVCNDAARLNTLSGLLVQEGLGMRVHDCVESALQDFDKEGVPDLVITDLLLPDIDGLWFCRLLRSPEYEALNRVPVLVVAAALTGAEVSSVCFAAGADAVLGQPLDGPRFIGTVRKLLRGEISPRGPGVLIAVAGKTLADHLKQHFEACGYWTDLAFTGRAATDEFGRSRHDLVVLDQHLPDMAGEALLVHFRERRPHSVIVMAAADPRPELVQNWLKKGAAAWLAKPFEAAQVVDLCARVRRERTLLCAENLLEEKSRELRASQDYLQAVLNGLPSHVAIVNGDGVIECVNDAWRRFSAEHCLDDAGVREGVNYLSVCEGAESSGAEGSAAFADGVREVLAGRMDKFELEYRWHSVNGERWFAGHVARVAGTPRAIIAQNNVTSLKQAEDKLVRKSRERRLLLDTIDTQIWYLTDAETYGTVNRAHADFLGFHPADIAYRKLGEFLPAEVAEVCRLGNRQAFETSQPVHTEEWIADANGERRLIAITRTPKLDAEGNVEYLVCAGTDITEQKQAETERLQLERQLQQVQKVESLARMAGAVAHHFNNSLGAVLGNLDLALEALPPAAGPRKNVVAAMHAAQRATDLSRLMLGYIGQTPARQETLDLSKSCSECISVLHASMPKTILLTTDFPYPGPHIQTDPGRLREILTNLVFNACEAIGDGEGVIQVAIRELKSEEIVVRHVFPVGWKPTRDAYVCLQITDTGCGMEPEAVDKIFDPFFSTKFTGRGLGLAVVAGAVRHLNGAVTVESTPGHGSTFRVLFPTLTPGAVKTEQATAVGTLPFNKNGKVLVVEDEAMLREMAQAMLVRLGFEVLAAADGIEALRVFRHFRDEIHCVLLDLTMPRMNGWETLAALRMLRPDVPVIMVSGYDEAMVMRGGHRQQPQVFLQKPYQLATLKDALTRAGAR